MIDHILACLADRAGNRIEPASALPATGSNPPAPSQRWNSPWTSTGASPSKLARSLAQQAHGSPRTNGASSLLTVGLERG